MRMGRCNSGSSLVRPALAAALGLLVAGVSARGDDAFRKEAEPRFQFGAELRARAETREGSGENPEREDRLATSRLRLDFAYRPRAGLSVFLQAQDSRVGSLGAGRIRAGFRNGLDLRQAYIAAGREDGPWTIRAGRQELSFIDDRVLGPRGWSNVSPTWDGSTLTLRRGSGELHLLGYTQAEIRDGLDPPSLSRFVYGMVGSAPVVGESLLVEPVLLTTRREVAPVSHLGGLVRTGGLRAAGAPAGVWEYQVILMSQGGGRADMPQRAWAGVWELGRTIPGAPASPRIGFEWSYASGDRDPGDGRNGTFDALFPSRHRHLGEQDLAGFRNLKYRETGVDLHPLRKLQVSVSLIDFRLASLRDGLYETGQDLRAAAPPGGASNSAIGSELDPTILYRPVREVQLRLGVSRFFAGPFVIASVPAGQSQTFLNAMLTIRL